MVTKSMSVNEDRTERRTKKPKKAMIAYLVDEKIFCQRRRGCVDPDEAFPGGGFH